MTRRVWAILMLALALPVIAAAQETTVILVRHAERADSPEKPESDPELSAAGKARAANLVEVLRSAGVAAVYTTQYIRTQTTAEPIAKMMGVAPTAIPFAGSSALAAFTDSLAVRILREHRGKTVLVVGHNSTTPQMVKALGGPQLPIIPESEFDNLYVVRVGADGKASFIRAKY